jgi:hypothetical protein
MNMLFHFLNERRQNSGIMNINYLITLCLPKKQCHSIVTHPILGLRCVISSNIAGEISASGTEFVGFMTRISKIALIGARF